MKARQIATGAGGPPGAQRWPCLTNERAFVKLGMPVSGEAALNASMARTPIYELLGLRLVSAGEGRAVLELECDERHANVDGAVHGGVVCLVADTAMGFAVRTQLAPNAPNKTLNLSIDYLRGAAKGDRLLATARVDHGTRRFRWASVELTTGSGAVAVARSLNLVEPTPSAA